jgi:hypothetical protein
VFEDVSGQQLPAGTHVHVFELGFSEPVVGVDAQGIAVSAGAFLVSTATVDRQTWMIEVAGLRLGTSFQLRLGDSIRDLAGQPLAETLLEFAVASGTVVYLREGGVGDGSSPASPSGNLVGAMVNAVEGTELWLAQGRFETFVELTRGVSMLCGFNATFTLRDPEVFQTVVSQDMLYASVTLMGAEGGIVRALDGCVLRNTWSGGPSLQPNVGIEVVGAGPLLTRNRVLTAGAYDSVGIRVRGGSPIVLANTVESAGVALGVRHVGIQLQAPGQARVVGNRVEGGDGAGSAIALECVEQDALLEGNALFGGGDVGTGLDNASMGLKIAGGAPRVFNNLIHGGGRRAATVGLQAEQTRALIVHNTIFAGLGISNASAVRLGSGANPALANNILFCSSASGRGLVEEGASADPASFQNNLLLACPAGLYLDEGSSRLDQPADIDALEGTPIEDGLCPGTNPCEHARYSANLITAMSPFQLFVDPAGPDGDPATSLDGDWRLGTAEVSILQGGKNTYGQDCGSLENPVSCGQVGMNLDGQMRVAPSPPGAY